MKMRSILIITVLCFLSQLSFSQISSGKEAIRKAEKKATDRIVEKTVNGIFNKIFGQDSSKVTKNESVKTDSTVTANSNPLGGLFSAKRVERKYDFDLTLDMEFKTEDKKGDGDLIPVKMHYMSDSSYIGMEMSSAINIMDYKQMKSYMIVGGNVTIIDMQKAIDKANKKSKKKDYSEDVTFKKTGKTEVIAGYKCSEYLVESEDGTGNFWITEDLNINVSTFQRAFDTNPNMYYPQGAQGIVLRMKIVDEKEKTVTTMDTNEVIKQQLKYDLSKYKASDLSRLGF